MKKSIGIIVFIFVLQAVGWSQDFNNINEHVAQTPQDAVQSVEALSQYLTKPFLNEREKFASIYSWVTHNIKYDVKSYKIMTMFNARTYSDPQMTIREVWDKRQGVCQHYAVLFHELSKKAGLKCEVVTGYTKIEGEVSEEGHVWNAVLVDSVWFLVDATWGAGFVDGYTFYPEFNPAYFLVKPEKSIHSHMPIDPLWQLLRDPVSYPEFDTLPSLDVKVGTIDQAYINGILSLKDEYDRTTGLIERIRKNGKPGKVVARNLEYEEERLEVQKFNRGVSCYNQSIELFNRYAAAFNRKFANPRLADEEIVVLIGSADRKMNEALEYLNEPYLEEKLNKRVIRQRMDAIELHKRITEQSAFVEKYVKTRKLIRPFLFPLSSSL